MKEKIMAFWYDEEGMGTLEDLIIVVVLVGIALIFKTKITDCVRSMLGTLDKESPTQIDKDPNG